MDMSQSAQIVALLNLKGFHLEESSPKQLRFLKQAGGYSEIIILNSPSMLLVRIKTSETITDNTARDFDDLKNYLKKTFE